MTQTRTITRIQEIIVRLQEALPLIIEEQQELPPGPLTIAEVEARHERREQIHGLIHEAYDRLRVLPTMLRGRGRPRRCPKMWPEESQKWAEVESRGQK